jgi:hypothetical protein
MFRNSSVWLSTGKTKIAAAPDIKCLIGGTFIAGLWVDSSPALVRDGRKNAEEKTDAGNVSFFKVNSLLSSGGRIFIRAVPPLEKSFETRSVSPLSLLLSKL